MTTATMTKVQVGDEFADMSEDAAKVVTAALKRGERKVAKARRELDALQAQNAKDAAGRKQKIDTLTAQSAAKHAQLTTVQKQIDDLPAEQQRLVTERLDAIQKANALLGQVCDWPAESTEGIRRFAVVARLGDQARSWNDSQIKAAFDSLEPPKPRHTANQQLRDVFSGPPSRPRGSVKDAYDDRLRNAWKDTVH